MDADEMIALNDRIDELQHEYDNAYERGMTMFNTMTELDQSTVKDDKIRAYALFKRYQQLQEQLNEQADEIDHLKTEFNEGVMEV